MAFSLSNGTSISSLVDLQHSPPQALTPSSDFQDSAGAKLALVGSRSDIPFPCVSGQGANATTSSNQTSASSNLKTRGDSSSSSGYGQQQSTLIQNTSLPYPLFYPTSNYLHGYTNQAAAGQYNYSSQGSSTMQNSQSSSAASSNRRGGKKKPQAMQQQNPELRFFFNLKRRDQQHTQKSHQSHIYKPKNPPTISEWFKRLTVEERVNALSTVCPHLTETFMSMFQKIEQNGGNCQFSKRQGPSSQDSKYFQQSAYMSPSYGFPQFFQHSSNDQLSNSFDDTFYHRPQSENEIQALRTSEKEKIEAEEEIFKNIRLTDYQSFLDTLTVAEELVQDADYFLNLMKNATNGTAFSSVCAFEIRSSSGVPTIEQPSWFKPKSFHNFVIWIIVALEENLWAHYNYDNNTNLGSVKANDLASLFREKTDMGAQDVELTCLANFWRDTNEKDKKVLIDSFKSIVVKEAEQEYNQQHLTHSKTQKVVHTKQMQYSVHIKEKPDKQNFQDQVDLELKYLVDYSLRSGSELDLLTQLIYTQFDKSSPKQVNINRKFLDLIKKKYKDDLMENLLQEEYQVKTSKQFKKKKKRNFNSNNQQSSQATPSTAEKIIQSSTDLAVNSDTQTDDQQKSSTIKNPKKKKGKCNASDKNMSSLETIPTSQNINPKKKKKSGKSGTQHDKESLNKTTDINSCGELQPKIEDSIEKEDTLESDNKNSSLDTKSSNNLFELVTAHQSTSKVNSAATFKSNIMEKSINIKNSNNKHKTPANIVQTQSSKSLDLNQSFKQKNFHHEGTGAYKQSKPISKVESKNYQILQNQSNIETQGQRAKDNSVVKAKNSPNQYTESKIFSEDDALKNNTNIEIEAKNETNSMINQYVIELANSMINEVCRIFENEQPDRPTESNKHQQNQKLSNLLSQKLSPESKQALDKEDQPHKQLPHKNFGKKQRKDSHQNPQKYYESQTNDNNVSGFRKKSFNSKKYIKDEKKFSEDYAENTSQQQQLLVQTTNPLIDQTDSIDDRSEVISRKSSTNDSTKGSSHHRKGFGVNLKQNEVIQNKEEKVQLKLIDIAVTDRGQVWAKGTAKQPDNIKKKQQQNNQSKKSDPNFEQDAINKSLLKSDTKDQEAHNQQNKKKRNKKKLKLTDTDIMNNFMKSLHNAHNEEHSQINNLNANKQNNQGGGQQQQQRKKQQNHELVKSQRPSIRQQPLDTISETQMSSSTKSEQPPEQDTNIPKSHNPHSQQKPRHPKHKYSQKNNHHQNQQQLQQQHQPATDVKNTSLNKQLLNETSPSSPQEKANKNPNEQQMTYQIKAKNAVIENAQKQQIREQLQIESEYSNKADCISDKSSNSLIEKTEPNRSNPFRYINFQATANDCENTSFTDLTATTNTAADTSLENNHYNNGQSKYQSYQNTPSKTLNTNSKTFHKQPNYQAAEETNNNSFRTPPQLSKKNQSVQQNYSHHGHYRKANNPVATGTQHYSGHQQTECQFSNNQGLGQSHIGQPKTTSRTSTQYRQVNRPPPTSSQPQINQPSNVYPQTPNLSISQSFNEQQHQQYLHPQNFISPENPNIFYQDPHNMLMGLQQNVDTFTPKQHDQVFHYVEKNPMMVQQPIPCYSPNNFTMNPYNQVSQMQDLQPNCFNYQRAPYFDQSQDLIYQIFNSIKTNNSLSPIPQMLSPPPVLDYQFSQSSDLSFGGCFPQRQDSAGYQDILFHQLWDQNITDFTNQVEESLKYLKPERDYVYEKILQVTKSTFPDQNPRLELFGSLTTGLALESSDMDLAVTGLQIDDRFVMINVLSKLAMALEGWSCLESFKSIETANIPVIKMKVNLEKLRDQEMPEKDEGDFTNRIIPESQKYLSVDITFDDSPVASNASCMGTQDIMGNTKTHLGLQSCSLVQYYIANYRCLKPVAILLKKFLALHSLNSPYYGILKNIQYFKGGISSYSTAILIVAYMNYYGLRDSCELTPSRLLMGFLNFYGNYFNPGSMGISVYEDGSFFQLNGLLDSNFVILDPLNLQNNTTRNSYLTKEILLKFQCAYNNLKSLMLKLPQLQQAVSSQTAFLRANSQDQKSSIPYESATPQPFIFQQNQQQTEYNKFGSIQETSNSQQLKNATLTDMLLDSEFISQKKVAPEEFEASRPTIELEANMEQQIQHQLQMSVNLLETFFVMDTQPANGELARLSTRINADPRGTNGGEAHAQ